MERLRSSSSLFLALLFLISSCSPWEQVRVEDPRLDQLEWKQKKKEGSEPRTLDLQVRARVKNPNKASFKVVGSDLDFYLDEKPLGEAELQENVKIPGNSEEEHSFHLKVELKDVALGGLKALGSVMGGSAPELRVEGHIKGRAYGIFTKEFPVNESRKINISDLMGQRIGFRSSITLTPKKPSAVRYSTR